MPLDYRNRSYIMNKDPKYVEALDDIINHVQNVMTQTNASPTGTVNAPPTPGGLTVSAANGIFEAAIQDNQSPVTRGVQYFLEHSDTPAFTAPKTISLGPSRNWSGALGNRTLYWRAHSAYPTSPRSGHVYHGGSSAQPLPVRGGGVVVGPTPLPSYGSGTSNGASGSDGAFGNNPFRGTSRPTNS